MRVRIDNRRKKQQGTAVRPEGMEPLMGIEEVASYLRVYGASQFAVYVPVTFGGLGVVEGILIFALVCTTAATRRRL